MTGNSEFETERENFQSRKRKRQFFVKTPESKSKKRKKKKKKKDTGVVNGVMKMSNICRKKFGSCTEEKLKEKKCGKTESSNWIFSEKNFSEGY